MLVELSNEDIERLKLALTDHICNIANFKRERAIYPTLIERCDGDIKDAGRLFEMFKEKKIRVEYR